MEGGGDGREQRDRQLTGRRLKSHCDRCGAVRSDRLQVYDVTKFLKLHPGGKKVLLGVGGQECTEQFNQFHNATAVLAKYAPKLLIGELAGGAAVPSAKKAAAAAADSQAVVAKAPAKAKVQLKLPNDTFGELVPYGRTAKRQAEDLGCMNVSSGGMDGSHSLSASFL